MIDFFLSFVRLKMGRYSCWQTDKRFEQKNGNPCWIECKLGAMYEVSRNESRNVVVAEGDSDVGKGEWKKWMSIIFIAISCRDVELSTISIFIYIDTRDQVSASQEEPCLFFFFFFFCHFWNVFWTSWKNLLLHRKDDFCKPIVNSKSWESHASFTFLLSIFFECGSRHSQSPTIDFSFFCLSTTTHQHFFL